MANLLKSSDEKELREYPLPRSGKGYGQSKLNV